MRASPHPSFHAPICSVPQVDLESHVADWRTKEIVFRKGAIEIRTKMCEGPDGKIVGHFATHTHTLDHANLLLSLGSKADNTKKPADAKKRPACKKKPAKAPPKKEGGEKEEEEEEEEDEGEEEEEEDMEVDEEEEDEAEPAAAKRPASANSKQDLLHARLLRHAPR